MGPTVYISPQPSPMDFWNQQYPHQAPPYRHHQQPQQPQQPQRRKTIPRPWLVKKQGQQTYYPHQQQQPQPPSSSRMTRETGFYHDGLILKKSAYNTTSSPFNTTTTTTTLDDFTDLDVWDRPSWSLSLGKLTSCWECMHPANNKNSSAAGKKSSTSLSKDVFGPFPAFPAIRRNSSQSIGSYELASSSNPQQPHHHHYHYEEPSQQRLPHYPNNYRNHHNRRRSRSTNRHEDDYEDDDSGSLSSFTASDSSSTSFSSASAAALEDDRERRRHKQQQQQQQQPRQQGGGPRRLDNDGSQERTREHDVERNMVLPPPINRTTSTESSPTPRPKQQQQQQFQPPRQQQPQPPSLRRSSGPVLPPGTRSGSLSSLDGGDTYTASRNQPMGGSSVPNKGTICGGGSSIPMRGRCDTGEYSKTSGTTNTSRHRRQGQYRFSQHSMELILDGAAGPLPPSEVVLNDRPARRQQALTTKTTTVLSPGGGQRQQRPSLSLSLNRSMMSGDDSGYVSPLEDEENGFEEGQARGRGNCSTTSNSLWVGREVGYTTNHPPFHSSTTNKAEEETDGGEDHRHLEDGWDQGSDDESDDGGNNDSDNLVESDEALLQQQQKRPPASPRIPFVPLYLRKSPQLEEQLLVNHHPHPQRVIISGWIAVAVGEHDSFEQRYHGQQKRMVALPDLYYLRLVVDEETQRASLDLHQTAESGTTHSYPLYRGWMVQTREVSSRHGRCVLVRQAGVGATPSLSLALLPVSTPDGLFATNHPSSGTGSGNNMTSSSVDKGILVSQAVFAKRRQQLFVPKGGRSSNFSHRAYAPDEQQDAAMFLMFSLDAWIKNSPL